MFDELNQETNALYNNDQEQVPAQEKKEDTSKQESQKETSMRILRERAEAAERRTRELEHMVQMNMSQKEQKTKIQLVDDEDDEFDVIADDSYIEGKQLKKYIKGLKQEIKKTKNEFQEYHKQSSLNQAEMRLQSQFTDFDNVVTKENLEKLSYQKPALYRTIFANSDTYDRGYTAYELIKNSGIVSNEYNDLDRKIEDNKSRPRSSSNASPQVGETPLARIGDYDRRILTEERKDQLRKQVEEAKRNKR